MNVLKRPTLELYYGDEGVEEGVGGDVGGLSSLTIVQTRDGVRE
mgnify:CR=1 FL=1